MIASVSAKRSASIGPRMPSTNSDPPRSGYAIFRASGIAPTRNAAAATAGAVSAPRTTERPTVAFSASWRRSAANDASRSPHRPAEEDDQGERQIEDDEFEADVGEAGFLRVDAAEAGVVRERRREHEIADDQEREQQREEHRRRADADLAGVVLFQKDEQQEDQQRVRDGEAEQDSADRAAAVAGEWTSVAVLLGKLPARETVAGEVDVQIRHDVADAERCRHAVAEDPVGARAHDRRPRRLELRRRRAVEVARPDERVGARP